MNNKLLSYDELKEELKALEALQSMHKRIYNNGSYGYKMRAQHQARAMQLKFEINTILSAIYHAKEARKLYEYKRLYDSMEMRGVEDSNCYLPEVD